MTTQIASIPLTSLDGPAAPAASNGRQSEDQGRLIVVDVFRLVAALLVVSYHFAPAARIRNPVLNWVAAHGFLGVELFFLISGFVICMSSWGRTVSQFFVSRVVRLYPAYWLAVLLTTAVVALWPVHQKPLTLAQTAGNLTMLQQWLYIPNVDDSYWTLFVELQFYLLFALVVWRGVNYRRVVGFCTVWTMVALAAPWTGWVWLTNLTAAPFAPYFIAGCALYLIHRFGPTLLLTGIVGFSYLVAIARVPQLVDFAHLPFTGCAILITVFFALMAAVSLGWFRWFRWRVGIVLGAMTYPLYLIHQSVGLTLIDEVGGRASPKVLFLGGVAVMLAAALAIHYLVEKPVGRRLKRALDRSLKAMGGFDGAAEFRRLGDIPLQVDSVGNHDRTT